jgi:hypothetical protein
MVCIMLPTEPTIERLMSTSRTMEKGALYSRTFTLMSSGVIRMRPSSLPLSL